MFAQILIIGITSGCIYGEITGPIPTQNKDLAFLTATHAYLHEMSRLNQFLQQIRFKLHSNSLGKEENIDKMLFDNFKHFAIKKHFLERRMPLANLENELIGKSEELLAEMKKEYAGFGKLPNQKMKFEQKIHSFFDRPLRQFFYANELNQGIKIRMSGVHSLVDVGDYEYDFLDKPNPPGRCIFRKWKDSELAPGHLRKAAPFIEIANENGENASKLDSGFDISAADQIFFGMTSKGWVPGNYGGMRYCTAYSYEFVCQLNGGNCSAEAQWPKGYRDMDNFLVNKYSKKYGTCTVFGEHYANFHRAILNAEHSPLELAKGAESVAECVVKDYLLQIVVAKELIFHQNGYAEQNASSLPAIVQFDTGHFVNKHTASTTSSNLRDCAFQLAEPTRIEEYLVLETENTNTMTYSAVVPARYCKVEGKQRIFVNNLVILDGTAKNVLHSFGAIDLLAGNKENILHFTMGQYKGEYARCNYKFY